MRKLANEHGFATCSESYLPGELADASKGRALESYLAENERRWQIGKSF
jgi:hypothetical protein